MATESQILGVILASLLHMVLGAALFWPRPAAIAPSVGEEPITVFLMTAATGSDESATDSQRSAVKTLIATRNVVAPEPASLRRRAPPRGVGVRHLSVVPAPAPSTRELVGAPHPDLRSAFGETLLEHIERFRHYPENARQHAEQGVALIGFAMDRRGGLIDVWLDRSSGYPPLDAEALDTVRRAQPLPPVPDSLPEPLQVVVPVEFALH
jgi:protein TonB